MFICRFCGAELKTGDPANVDHCIRHIGLTALIERVRRTAGEEGAEELIAKPAPSRSARKSLLKQRLKDI